MERNDHLSRKFRESERAEGGPERRTLYRMQIPVIVSSGITTCSKNSGALTPSGETDSPPEFPRHTENNKQKQKPIGFSSSIDVRRNPRTIQRTRQRSIWPLRYSTLDFSYSANFRNTQQVAQSAPEKTHKCARARTHA